VDRPDFNTELDVSPNPSTANPDRLLTAKQLKHRVLFSLQHLYRLEERGQFPQRIHLGKARIAWSASDVTAWMQSKIEARGPCPFAKGPVPRLNADDRFIGKKELKTLVVYSAQHIRLLELESQFPTRIWIGENRVAWLEREVIHWMSGKRQGSAPTRVYHRRSL